MINETIERIKQQTGVQLEPCDHFSGIRTHRHSGEKYFNALLGDRDDFVKIQRYANAYGSIRVEPNGVKRIAIFPIK